MLGLTTALIVAVLMIVSLILLFSVAFIVTMIERFQMWIVVRIERIQIWLLRKITSPHGPPWKRNHIGLNHVSTDADPNHMKIGTLVLPNYKTAL